MTSVFGSSPYKRFQQISKRKPDLLLNKKIINTATLKTFYPTLSSNTQNITPGLFKQIAYAPFELKAETRHIALDQSKESFNTIHNVYCTKLELLQSVAEEIKNTPLQSFEIPVKRDSLNMVLKNEFTDFCRLFEHHLLLSINNSKDTIPVDFLIETFHTFVETFEHLNETLFKTSPSELDTIPTELLVRIIQTLTNIQVNALPEGTIAPIDGAGVASPTENHSGNKPLLKDTVHETIALLKKNFFIDNFSNSGYSNPVVIEKVPMLSTADQYKLLYCDNTAFETLLLPFKDIANNQLLIKYIYFLRENFDTTKMSPENANVFLSKGIQNLYQQQCTKETFITSILVNSIDQSLKASLSHISSDMEDELVDIVFNSINPLSDKNKQDSYNVWKEPLINWLATNSNLPPTFYKCIPKDFKLNGYEISSLVEDKLELKFSSEKDTSLASEFIPFTERYCPIQGENIKSDFKSATVDTSILKRFLSTDTKNSNEALDILFNDLETNKFLSAPASGSPRYYMPKVSLYKTETGQSRCEFEWDINLKTVNEHTLQAYLTKTNSDVNSIKIIDALKNQSIINSSNEIVEPFFEDRDLLESTVSKSPLLNPLKESIMNFFDLKKVLHLNKFNIQADMKSKVMRNTYIVNIRYTQSMLARAIPTSPGFAHTEMVFRYQDEAGSIQNMCCGMVGYGKNELYDELFNKSDGSLFQDGIRFTDANTAINCIESAMRRREPASKQLNWVKGTIYNEDADNKLQFFYNNWHPTLRLDDFFERTTKRGLIDFVLRQNDFSENINSLETATFISNSINKDLSKKIFNIFQNSNLIANKHVISEFQPLPITSLNPYTDTEISDLINNQILDENGYITSNFSFGRLKLLENVFSKEKLSTLSDDIYYQLGSHKLRNTLINLGLTEQDLEHIKEKINLKFSNLKRMFPIVDSVPTTPKEPIKERFHTYLQCVNGAYKKKYVNSKSGNLNQTKKQSFERILLKKSSTEDPLIQSSIFTNMYPVSPVKYPIQSQINSTTLDHLGISEQELINTLQTFNVLNEDLVVQIDSEKEFFQCMKESRFNSVQLEYIYNNIIAHQKIDYVPDPQGSYFANNTAIKRFSLDEDLPLINFNHTPFTEDEKKSILSILKNENILNEHNIIIMDINSLTSIEDRIKTKLKEELGKLAKNNNGFLDEKIIKIYNKLIQSLQIQLSPDETNRMVSFNKRYNSPSSLCDISESKETHSSLFLEDHLFDDEATWCTHFVMERFVYDTLESNPTYRAAAEQLAKQAKKYDFSNLDHLKLFKEQASEYAQKLVQDDSLKDLRNTTANPYAPPLNLYQMQHTWVSRFKDTISWMVSSGKKVEEAIQYNQAMDGPIHTVSPPGSLVETHNLEPAKKSFETYLTHKESFELNQLSINNISFQSLNRLFLMNSKSNDEVILEKIKPYISDSKIKFNSPINKDDTEIFITQTLTEKEVQHLSDSTPLILQGLDRFDTQNQINLMFDLDKHLSSPSLERYHFISKFLESDSIFPSNIHSFKNTVSDILKRFNIPQHISEDNIITLLIEHKTDSILREFKFPDSISADELLTLLKSRSHDDIKHYLLNTYTELADKDVDEVLERLKSVSEDAFFDEFKNEFQLMIDSQKSIPRQFRKKASSIYESLVRFIKKENNKKKYVDLAPLLESIKTDDDLYTSNAFYYLSFIMSQLFFISQKYENSTEIKQLIYSKLKEPEESNEKFLSRLQHERDNKIHKLQQSIYQNKYAEFNRLLHSFSDLIEEKLTTLMQAYTYANHPDTTVEESTKRNLNTTIQELSSTLAIITKKRIATSKKTNRS